MRRWLAGESNIPDNVWYEIQDLLVARRQLIEETIELLDAARS